MPVTKWPVLWYHAILHPVYGSLNRNEEAKTVEWGLAKKLNAHFFGFFISPQPMHSKSTLQFFKRKIRPYILFNDEINATSLRLAYPKSSIATVLQRRVMCYAKVKFLPRSEALQPAYRGIFSFVLHFRQEERVQRPETGPWYRVEWLSIRKLVIRLREQFRAMTTLLLLQWKVCRHLINLINILFP